MRDDPEYWEALSGRIVSDIRDRRASPLGWRVWAAPLAAAAVLAVLIARGQSTSSPDRAPSIAAMLSATDRPAPSVAVLLRGQP
jgi:hypothetical protein